MGFRRNKYNRSPRQERTAWGIVFDSKKEMNRYKTLRKLLTQKKIANLKRQPKFTCVVNGAKICDYFADFEYTVVETGETIIEDVKGMKTPMYRLKKKLVEALHPIKITET